MLEVLGVSFHCHRSQVHSGPGVEAPDRAGDVEYTDCTSAEG